MIDVQKQPALNEIDIDKVGVCDMHYPVEVLDKTPEKQRTKARTTMGSQTQVRKFVNLNLKTYT